MLELTIMTNRLKQLEYDSEPVSYCTKCYSLRIKYEEVLDTDCCMDCGCLDIAETSVDNWERMYERRYGHKYIVKSDNIRDSFVFKLTTDELKTRLYNHPQWREIVFSLYPRFPKGFGRADSIILLFDKLIKDRRMDDLRMKLVHLF